MNNLPANINFFEPLYSYIEELEYTGNTIPAMGTRFAITMNIPHNLKPNKEVIESYFIEFKIIPSLCGSFKFKGVFKDNSIGIMIAEYSLQKGARAEYGPKSSWYEESASIP